MRIKCTCEQEDCKSYLELFENGLIHVIEIAGVYNTSATFQLPLHIAKAMAKAIQHPHVLAEADRR